MTWICRLARFVCGPVAEPAAIVALSPSRIASELGSFLGSGLGSGALLTLGSDLAPPGQPGPFLAAFAVMQDTGKVLGPILVGVIGEQAGLDTAAAALAVLTVATAVWLVVVVGETSDGGGRLVRRVD